MNRHKTGYWITLYSIVAAALIAIYYVVDLNYFDAWGKYVSVIKKVSLSLFFITVIFLASKMVRKFIINQVHNEGDRYNLNRIVRLVAIILSLFVIASFMLQNLVTTLVSVGLISLVLGFALQAPISSFIAWVYLVFRRSYLVGDRIQIKNFRGDVIEISYLDTSILECSGDYLGNDRRSGRVVRFPNSLILREEVINYSGPDIPFIWNETAIHIAFTSEIQFVENILLEAALIDFQERYPKFAKDNPTLWKPAVYFRNNPYSWMEAVISYPVEPEDTTGRRNRILKHVLPLLNSNPDKVQFPEGRYR